MAKKTLSQLIDAHFDLIEDAPRDYIGASSIGSECLRQIWFQFKGVKAEAVPSKFRKAWAIGKILEGMIIEWLIKAGIQVEQTDKTYQADGMPYFQGHFDGIMTWRKKRAILEIKTAKHASYTIFVKKGLQVWNPQYYAQIQSYMGMSGIHSAHIIVLDKDSGELADEAVTFNADVYESLKDKARLIYEAPCEPPKINGSPLFFKCKMCQFNKVCHN